MKPKKPTALARRWRRLSKAQREYAVMMLGRVSVTDVKDAARCSMKGCSICPRVVARELLRALSPRRKKAVRR